MLIRIIDSVPDIVDIGFLNQGAGGTAVNALSAVCAYHVAHWPVVERGYLLMRALVGHGNCRDVLKLGACSYASLTPDAFAVVLHKRRRRPVDSIGVILDEIKENGVAKGKFVRKGLQFAFLVLITLCAVRPVF